MTDHVVESLHRSLALMAALVLVAAGCDGAAPAGAGESTFEACSDGVDNDEDGAVDCVDEGCAVYCGIPSGGGNDGGPEDAASEDPGPVDGGADAAPPEVDDGGADAAPPEVDDGGADAAPPEVDDGGADGDVEAGPTEPASCSAGTPCSEPGLLCFDFFLDGDPVCAPRGASCVRSSDCDAGVPCGEVPGWSEGGRYCLTTEATCASDAACPDGFRCESGECVDRRRTCVNNGDCPSWGRCMSIRSGLRVCMPSLGPIPCADAESCGGGALCVDVDGDGRTECQESYGSTCTVNADCAEGVCGNADGLPGAECGPVGPCLVSADCPTGFSCADVNADGALECQPEGGTCTHDADCPERTLCFDTDGADGAACS